MRRVLLSTVLLIGATGAHAGDFTGFYAGINAGYALGHESDRTTGRGPSPVVKPAADLPPSAQDAASTLRRSQAGRSGVPFER